MTWSGTSKLCKNEKPPRRCVAAFCIFRTPAPYIFSEVICLKQSKFRLYFFPAAFLCILLCFSLLFHAFDAFFTGAAAANAPPAPVIVLDAGHGGSDPGALGFFSGYHEENLNLGITLSLKEKLEALGATVVMSRSEDATVNLYERMDLLTATHPDLSISIHHNSTGESSDANKVGGTLGLYWSEAGISLSRFVQKSVADTLGNGDLGAKKQMLALCRNHRFPQTLLETSFICSPNEYQFAISTGYYDQVADAVAEGVLDWYAFQASFLGR